MIAADGQSTQTVTGGVTAPAGFRAAGVACGIKANGKLDLALLVSDGEASAAGGLHDQRGAGGAGPRVARAPAAGAAAPRPWSSTAAAPTPAPARTACAHAREMAAADRRRRSAATPTSVLVASTGVIGVKLPMAKVAARHRDCGRARCRPTAAPMRRARIMTTDPFPKEAAVEVHRSRQARSASAAWPRARA